MQSKFKELRSLEWYRIYNYKAMKFLPGILQSLLVLLLFQVSAWGQNYTVVKDEFANRPFGKDFSIKSMTQGTPIHWELEIKQIDNRYTAKKDSLYVFKYLQSRIIFYKTEGGFLFRSALILDKGILLKYQIEIGISRMDLLKKLKLPSSIGSNVIVVTDKENGSDNKFYLINNVLSRIELDPGFD